MRVCGACKSDSRYIFCDRVPRCEIVTIEVRSTRHYINNRTRRISQYTYVYHNRTLEALRVRV